MVEEEILVIFFSVSILVITFPVAYLLLLAVSSIRNATQPLINSGTEQTHFVIAIAAHNEAAVITSTVQRLKRLDYPAHLMDICIVADHCSDETAVMAEEAGVKVFQRQNGPRTGKGAALAWLFGKILENPAYDAVVVFDADTQVNASFLRVMDARLSRGEKVIQGQHVIHVGQQSSSFPQLVAAMFLIDNRFQNLGRANLGWSAKIMGDSICFRTDVIRNTAWGDGLTDDYQLRQKLLLQGIKVTYAPAAVGVGEVPGSWQQAKPQRARWLRGTLDANRKNVFQLLKEGLRRKDLALLDGTLQALFPSYSTLTLVASLYLITIFILTTLLGPIFPPMLIVLWVILFLILFIYPFFGLMLEHAPWNAYWGILSGPFFILWRTWLAFKVRFLMRYVPWVRTEHGNTSHTKGV